MPDEATFFERVASESGVPEKDLRDVLVLTGDGKVQVSQPAKDLGKSNSAQARTVVALVGGARSNGLEEDPVDADAVRAEVARKRCFDQSNFAQYVLGPMKGFNAGSDRTQIRRTSKWVDEFTAAVNQALGKTDDADEEK